MTKINKLVMHGFKSFARRTELLFGDNFNVVLGPNGSGKCLDKDAFVQMADGSLNKIGELVNEKIKTNNINKLDDGFMAYGDSTKIISLDLNSLKTVERPIQAYIKRKAPKQLLKIKTRTGREITATEYHPLFVLNNGKIESIKAEDLKEGIRIAVPRELKIKNKTAYFYELLDLIKEKDNIYVPYDDKLKEVLVSLKGELIWKEIADKIGIPLNSIKGLLDKQSINFAHLIKILRFAKFKNEEIISLIPRIKSKNSSKTYKMIWKNSPEFARFFGYLLSEGRLPETSNQIWFTNGTEEIVEDYKQLIDFLFDVNSSINEYKPNCWDVIAYSSPIRTLLTKFGMPIFGGTEKKEITNLFLSNSSETELAELLNGLYCGDGYISNNSIEITSKSFKLASSIQTILLRLGILSHSKEVIKIATNSGFSGLYRMITIYGADNFNLFNEKISLIHNEKRNSVNALLGKKSNPNIDLLEINDLIKETVKDLSIKVKKTKKAFPRLDSYVYNQCTPSSYGVKHLVDNLFTSISSGNQQSLLKIKKLCESYILWDEIIEIKKIKPEHPWVYDLCIEEHHNFIANNFFVHNSNIMDALCFVLGRMSTKSLRAEKSANLIYNGGKLKKPMNQGEVSIWFDNAKKTFPTDDAEIKITRLIRKNGQSVYKINDKKRTRQQILELMSVAKIDPEGYNIILQGDIIRFTEMHVEERRKLIEEISGISVYEDKKLKALRELDKVEEKLKEADIVLNERNNYMKELRKERDQALKFKDLKDRITENKASYVYIQLEKSQKEKDELDARIKERQEKLDEFQSKINGLKKQVEEKRNEILGINREIEQKGEKEQVSMHKDIEATKVNLATNKTRIENLRNEIEKISLREKQLKNDLTGISNQIEELNMLKEETRKKKESKIKESEMLEKQLGEFKRKNQLDNLAEIETAVDKIDSELEEFEKKAHELRERQQSLLREKDQLEFQINSIDEKIEKVKEVEKENKKQIDELKDKKQRFRKAIGELNERLAKDSEFAKRISDSKKRLSDTEEKLAKLRLKDITIQESLSSFAIKKILSNKSLKGVYGTVSQLGSVQSKYSLALEIAAGTRMNSLVVEDDKTAAECIKYLKSSKFGTATFIPLNKIKQRQEPSSEILKMNGVHGTAIDLISFDSKFRKAFSYIFGDTIVVNDIETARKAGIGKARMVTLDGDLAEFSGVMQGGYRKKEGRASFQQDEIVNEIKTNESAAEKFRNEVSGLEKERNGNEFMIEKLRKERAELEGDVIRLEKSMHLDSSDLDASLQAKKELESKAKDAGEKLNSIISDISELNKSIAKAKAEKQAKRDMISQLRNPSLLAQLNAFEEKRAEFRDEALVIENQIKAAETKINDMLEPEKEKINEIIRQQSKESERFRNETEKLAEEVKKSEKELAEKERNSQKFYAAYKGLFVKRDSIGDEVQKTENRIEELREKSKEEEIKMNKLSLENARISAELAGFKHEFEQYEGVKINKEKPEDELRKEIQKFERMVSEIGNVNMRALEIYEDIEKEYNILLGKKDKLGKEKEEVISMMNEIEGKKKDLFMKTFDIVNENFRKRFSELTTKGEASLVLENDDNPFEGGLDIRVRITGSKFLDIRSLSGGEKTMTALAFIFAIQEYEPHSFYVLDEVDAALDKRNSEKLAKLIRNYCGGAQYLMISHNDGIISEADNLYGISMDEHGVSKVVSLKL